MSDTDLPANRFNKKAEINAEQSHRDHCHQTHTGYNYPTVVNLVAFEGKITNSQTIVHYT
ncbi:MAG: hypothetical protein CL876_02275 [Dehalococcoidales bacterium]|nr:hypothetical protein [Dehalococcoidales bacterium]